MAYKTAQFIYSRLRMQKNRVLNRIDLPVVVLIYHRVTRLSSDPQLLAVAPDNFRAQMSYLKRNFPLVRLEEDWSTAKKPAVAITFDDGYSDNALEALPILEEVGVPATFFVSTGTIGTRREFWWDELERIILKDHSFPERFTLDDPCSGGSWPSGTPLERQVLYQELHPLMKNADVPTREKWLAQLRQWAQAGEEGREEYRTMTVDELQRLADSPLVTIGAHTAGHVTLSGLSVEEQRDEICSSKHQLETTLGRRIPVFSYPFGRKSDYTAASVRICRDAGFVRAAANFPGQVHSWTDPFQLPRQLVRNWDLAEFAAQMERFWV